MENSKWEREEPRAIIHELHECHEFKSEEQEQFSHGLLGLVGLERCLWQGKWCFCDT